MGLRRDNNHENRTAAGECCTCGQAAWLDEFGMCGGCFKHVSVQAEIGMDLLGEFLLKHALFDRFLRERGMAA